ncbi:protein I'm not dead yet-like isoform X2 [Pararge aegeria]|uniref:protein I'm not dead yet-like isoform X2 n=1 Tax=Pararge aegeria TaxID=116150 RepID=UPI0019D2E8A8|nr:protein I'm not dead yet-like isoform X2 [Pararge aegeria]
MGGFVSGVASVFKRRDPRTPVKGALPRLKNIFTVHYRGVLGVLVPLLILTWQPKKGQHDITVACLWFWMAWFLLLQPVNIPVVGFIPLFLLPMTGVIPTVDLCKCYFDDNIALFILAGMVHLLLNSCGADRRIILWLLCSGDSCQFSGKRIIFKASAAAFFLSMISNRLIVTSTITQFLAPAYMNLQSSTSSYRTNEPDYDVMRHIVLCAVQTASSIGSVAVLHASFSTLAMRAIWCSLVGKPMSGSSMAYMRNMLLEQDKLLKPFLTDYQKCCIFFYFAYLAACMFRWSDWLNMGWSGFEKVVPEIPMIKDATVAALFVIVLHILPKSFLFTNYVTARVKSHIGDVLKPDSPVMWWRYVDKNTNYGYIILMGGAIALNLGIRVSKLNESIPNYGKHITDLGWNASLLVICIIAAILPNIMSSVAACAAFLPFVLHMAAPSTTLRQGDETPAPDAPAAPSAPAAPAPANPTPWSSNFYLGALIVGIGSSFGFAAPFLYTPAYFCHYTGKVPIKQMIKYAIGSLIICIIVLWPAICFYAPIIWVDQSVGIKSYSLAPPAGGDAPAPSPGTP